MGWIRKVAAFVLWLVAAMLAMPALLLAFAAEKLSDYADELVD